MSGQPAFEEYTATIKSFYIKVMKGHSNMLRLSRNFMQIIEDLSKMDNTLKSSRISRKKSQISLAASKSKSLKSVRSLSTLKANMAAQYLFSSAQIKKLLLYAYLHHIISTSNVELFNMIETKSKLLIQSSLSSLPQIDKGKWERCIGEWKKIMQLMNHKNKVRWEKMMNIAIAGLQLQFVEVVIRGIFWNSVNLQIFNDFQANLQQIASLLKVSIAYQVTQKGQEIKKNLYGDFKHQIRIGYIKNQNIYVIYDKLATQKSEKSEKQLQTQKKPESKFLSVSTKSVQNQKPKYSSNSPTSQIQINTPQSPVMSKNSDIKSRTDLDNKSQKSVSETSKKRPVLPSSLVRKKNLRILQALLKQFNSNTNKLIDLECFQNQESKDVKIKKILESRKKIQQ